MASYSADLCEPSDTKRMHPVADPENFGGGMIKILSRKPQKFRCVVTRRAARNSQWSGCFMGLGAEPPALKNFAFFCKNNLILELV